MPICRTCQGEYTLKVVSPPPSGASEGATGAPPPPSEPKVCPRCGGDLQMWNKLDTTLADFIVWEGGILALLPAAAAMAVWLLWIPIEEWGFYFPALTAVCLGMCVLVFFLVYFKRLFWWEHMWAQQIYRVSRISIDAVMALTGVGGLLCSPLWVLLYTNRGRPEGLVDQAIFGSVYVTAFVCLTAAATLAVVGEYVAKLQRYAPPPIFVSTERLLRVVANEVIYSINLPKAGPRPLSLSTPAKPIHEVVQTLRVPEDGGIHVLLRECKRVQYPSGDGQMQAKWMEMFWRVEADRWGRLQKFGPTSQQPNSGTERAFRIIGGNAS